MKPFIFFTLLLGISPLFARYNGARHVKNQAAKQITIINESNTIMYITFKVPAIHYGTDCMNETCFDKQTTEIMQWRLKPYETQIFNLDWTETKTNDGVDGAFAFNQVIYASVKWLNPNNNKWEKSYITIKDQKQYILSTNTGKLSIVEG